MLDTLLFRVANRQAGGRLAQKLQTYRRKGYSFNEISRRLYADHRIEVTGQTLSTWVRQIEDAAA